MVSPTDLLSLEASITCMAFFADRNCLLIGDANGMLHIWQLSGRRQVIKHQVFSKSSMRAILCLANGLLLLQGAHDQSVSLMRLNEDFIIVSKEEWPATNHMGFCKSVKAGAEHISLPQEDCDICVRKVVNFEQCQVLRTKSKVGMIMCLESTDDTIIAGYENQSLFLWDWPKEHVLHSLSLSLVPLDLALDQNFGMAVGTGAVVQVFKLTEEKLELCVEQNIPAEGNSSVTIRTSNEAPFAATGCWDNTIRLFSWKKPSTSLKPLGALKFHKDKVDCVVTAGKLLAAASKDGVISLWNLY